MLISADSGRFTLMKMSQTHCKARLTYCKGCFTLNVSKKTTASILEAIMKESNQSGSGQAMGKRLMTHFVVSEFSRNA